MTAKTQKLIDDLKTDLKVTVTSLTLDEMIVNFEKAIAKSIPFALILNVPPRNFNVIASSIMTEMIINTFGVK